MMPHTPTLAVAAITLLLAQGCQQESASPGKPPAMTSSTPSGGAVPHNANAPVSVARIALGKMTDSGKTGIAETDTFGKTDTIHAAVDTTGSGNAKLTVRWTLHSGDQPIKLQESTSLLSASGPTANQFNISTRDGWLPGNYQFEIFIDGKPVAVKKFSIQ